MSDGGHPEYPSDPADPWRASDQPDASRPQDDPALFDLHAELVRRVQRHEPGSGEDLHAFIVFNTRFVFSRIIARSGEDKDRIHDIFAIVLDAIRNGRLREPERLLGYVRAVARWQATKRIKAARLAMKMLQVDDQAVQSSDSPFHLRLKNEQRLVLEKALTKLVPQQQEILRRFYLQEQDEQTICRELSLTPTQFRLSKSRGKLRLGVLGKKLLEPVTTAFVVK